MHESDPLESARPSPEEWLTVDLLVSLAPVAALIVVGGSHSADSARFQ